MWHLVEKLLQLALITATASALFVVGAVVVSQIRPVTPPQGRVSAADATLEVRLTSPDNVDTVFAGQPLVVDLVLLNLDARRARNRTPVDPEGAAAEATILLDDQGKGSPVGASREPERVDTRRGDRPQ